jgi:ElaB/YqjD/DUF883 family membrane-anchored ribosome-binding protein
MGKNQPDYITKDYLSQALRKLYTDLRSDLRADIRQDIQSDMRVLLDTQTELIRDELNSKLSALENRMDKRFTETEARLMETEKRLIAHTQEVVGNSAVELLENIASVVDPKGKGLKGRKFRHFRTT